MKVWPTVAVVSSLIALVVPAPEAVAHENTAHGIAYLVGVPTIVGTALYDIGSAPRSAHRYNERALAVTPIVDVAQRGYGLQVSWSFGAKSKTAPASAGGRGRRSGAAALAISALATAVPIVLGAPTAHKSDLGVGLMAAGVVLGPSAGHLYAGEYRRGLTTAGLRFGVGASIWVLSGCEPSCGFVVGD